MLSRTRAREHPPAFSTPRSAPTAAAALSGQAHDLPGCHHHHLVGYGPFADPHERKPKLRIYVVDDRTHWRSQVHCHFVTDDDPFSADHDPAGRSFVGLGCRTFWVWRFRHGTAPFPSAE